MSHIVLPYIKQSFAFVINVNPLSIKIGKHSWNFLHAFLMLDGEHK